MKMKTFFVQTQLLENYGAHESEGTFPDEARWKFKAGDDFIVTNCLRIQDAVALVAHETPTTMGFVQFPCSWEEVRSDFMTPFEKSQLKDDGFIQYGAQRIDYQDVSTHEMR